MSSLYIHMPFCGNKCFYCSFIIAVGQQQRVPAYLDCLSREAQQCAGREVETVYVGGGTPTILNNDDLRRLMGIIKENFHFRSDAEVSIEANPETIDYEKAGALFDLGFNRVSLGIQSLNDRYLQKLGRRHDRATAISAYASLRKAGFKNINLDLMYGFPGQKESEIREDVRMIAGLRSEHLSLYSLNVEENSRFFVRGVRLPAISHQAKFYVMVAKELAKAGFRQYEISNFSQNALESRHNICYWIGGNYLGLGLGAHSHFDGRRSWNISRLPEYIRRVQGGLPSEEGREVLTAEQRFLESLVFGLRMNQGVSLEALEKKYSILLDDPRKVIIDECVRQGLLERGAGWIKTSMKGKLVLDEISARLI
ncbi:MAG: radical SAM family heme chaperone HemW [Candidatus Omnitrophota bacterium]